MNPTTKKVAMITIITASIAALLLLIGLGSNLFMKSDNPVEEACEEGIKDLTGQDVDLSPWNGEPRTEAANGMNAPPVQDTTIPQQEQVVQPTSQVPEIPAGNGMNQALLVHHDKDNSCNGPSMHDAASIQNGNDPCVRDMCDRDRRA